MGPYAAVRKHGNAPYKVAVIHGGPGAPGCAEPLARDLSEKRGVLEPWQSADSVDGLIEELKAQLEGNGDLPVVLVGHSWGAWLAYMFAARHTDMVSKLILVSSGGFEERDGARIVEDRLGRLPEDQREEARHLLEILNDPAVDTSGDTLARIAEIFVGTDIYEPIPHKNPRVEMNQELHKKVWAEAAEMRRDGTLLELAKGVRCPVVAVHGDCDPHPADGVEKPLSRVLKDFKFILLQKCGHEPWIEKHARDRFYAVLDSELARRGRDSRPTA